MLASGRGGIAAYDASGKRTAVVQGTPANDLAVTSKGDIYFTDPQSHKVWFVSKDGTKKTVHEGLLFPNEWFLADEALLLAPIRELATCGDSSALQQRDADDQRRRHGHLHVTAATIAAAGDQCRSRPERSPRSTSRRRRGRGRFTNIAVNGELQVPTSIARRISARTVAGENLTSPSFKNQGDCVSYFATDGVTPATGNG